MAKKEAKTKPAKKVIAKKIEKPIKKVIAKTTKATSSKKVTAKTVTVKPKIINEQLRSNLFSIVAIIVIIAIFAALGFLVDRYNQKNKPTPKKVAAAQSISYDCVSGKTALDLLKDKADAKTVDSSYGVYVSQINDTTNSEGSFWVFYVNDQMAQVSPDQYTCIGNEKVEWRFEKII